MPRSLERLRSKIEAGERLDDAELELLQREARAQPGPTLKIAVAHALINAERPADALGLLSTLASDFPGEIQVHLALARAYGALERWSDAEKALAKALAVNPEDPDALKTMALLDLRRGEFSRARARIARVREVDPFDGEAKLIEEELNATDVEPPRRQRASRQQFTDALLSRLKQQSTPFLMQRDALLVRLGKGGVARVDLGSLYTSYASEGRTLDDAVTAIARELAERSLGVPDTPEAVLERVMPVLRDDSFLERSLGAVRREGPAGLFVYYVLDDSELVRYLPEGALQSRRLTLEQVDDAAWRNLAARATEPKPVAVDAGLLVLAEGTGLWALAEGDGHDGARLLTAAQRERIAAAAGQGPWRVFFGRREVAALCREADAAARAMLDQLSAADDGIAGTFVLQPDGRLGRG